MNNLSQDGRVITVIMPKGAALPLLKALFEKGVTRANFAFARGFDIHDIDNPRTGFPDAEEKEIVSVIAKDATEADELFGFIYDAGELGKLGGGLMYMAKLGKSSGYELPKIEEAQKQAGQAVEASP